MFDKIKKAFAIGELELIPLVPTLMSAYDLCTLVVYA